MDPPWKGQNLVTTSTTLTVLVWAFLCRSSSSQNLAFTLAVPDSVSVQHGFCIHIPCQFTYDRSKISRKLYGYWYQKRETSTNLLDVLLQAFLTPGVLVATNDKTQRVQPFFANRFHLSGDPNKGDCSFSILNAQLQDNGEYVFQIADSLVKFIYLTSHDPAPRTVQVLVTEFTEKPDIVKLPTLVSGEEAIVTCLAPGPCFRIEPEISWETAVTGYDTSEWSEQHNQDSWTYGSNFIFTPSLNDQGKLLTCRVWYPHVQKQVESTIRLDVTTTHDEFQRSSAAILLIVLCLNKVLFCFLFFFSVVWFLNRRNAPLRGEEQMIKRARIG
ncbi:myeloid cell surface antigen CD33-like [Paroedura picta]|uniref:myeloid cell surface antigen CD33-like n=1 Tax=Paroedura picta TaxID=143630 RepID=UPI0040572CF5